jgi:AraC-like DNA-binding protein
MWYMASSVSTMNRIRANGTFTEAATWRDFGAGWRPLWAGFKEYGFSVEWHDFECQSPLELAASFHPESVEICLNLEGHAEFDLAGQRKEVPPGTATFYSPGRKPLEARRLPRQRHQFITIEISRDFLKQRFAGNTAGLHPHIRGVLAGKKNISSISEVRRLTTEHQRLIPALQHSPVPLTGRAVWFEGKVLELMSEFFFVTGENELFCERQRRVATERVNKVISLLRGNLAAPPDLLELGRRVGCSPFHLSRTFSQELGMTIPRYLRQLRMESAAKLLLSGKFNVTEAALEVGYSSLSHFSQAFCQTMGCCPNLYPLVKGATTKPA